MKGNPVIEKIKSAPLSPGCYIYRNIRGRILYIGKAVNIRSRVKSYFSSSRPLDPKIAIMVKQIADVEFITTDSEVESLILETNLIKKYRPKYNRMMKDDKNYSWLMITKNEDFPRIEFIREKKFKTADYFGPYSDKRPLKRALDQLRTIFPYRSCRRKMYYTKNEEGKNVFYSSDKKPCLYFYLNLCDGPCTGNVPKRDYRKNINNIKRFFRSKKFEIIKDLQKEMTSLAQDKNFEKAAILRDKLQDLKYIASRIQVEKEMDERLWKEKQEKSSLTGLKNLIKQLKIANCKFKKDFRIECYDISNISGKSATGSMVVFINGSPDKHQYRKFKIKTKDTPDDFFMLREVYSRRFKRKKKSDDKSFSTLPDLLIVDGGKGQLSSTLEIIEKMKLEIPTIGLAKKEEEIFKSEDGEFKKIKLRSGSLELFLIQKVRDEAHRFAIKYHKVLRSKKQVSSVLDTIPGIGKLVKKRLLKAFGSAEGIKKASFADLQSVVKNRRTVENIKKLL